MGRITPKQVAEIANVLPRFFDTIVDTAAFIARAVETANQLDHPVCDCLYLALAETQQATLITAGMHLISKIRSTHWEDRAISLAGYGAPGD